MLPVFFPRPEFPSGCTVGVCGVAAVAGGLMRERGLQGANIHCFVEWQATFPFQALKSGFELRQLVFRFLLKTKLPHVFTNWLCDLEEIIPPSLLNEVKALNSIRDSKLGVGGSLRWINFRDSTPSTGNYKV